MNQTERRKYLIEKLLSEKQQYNNIKIPDSTEEQKSLLRALMNMRMPEEIDEEFLSEQNIYLQKENEEKGIVTLSELTEIKPDIFLWRGDISCLKVGAIVNAANSGMTGCYMPNHNCIDNCIHTFAGIQLRLKCAEIMNAQGFEEPTGRAKITPSYNLPCDYILHTVGPIVRGKLTAKHEELLASCYKSCLKLAEEYRINSIAFCCISTGVFMFPNKRAAEIAVETVTNFKKETHSKMKIIFNVFKEYDEIIYKELLQ